MTRRRLITFLLLCACVLATSAAASAHTISLNEKGNLHRTSSHGLHLNEEGTASGTIKGPIYIHLDVTSINQVTAEVNVYPNNGSLTGYAVAKYHSGGSVATFSGTMSINRGTGAYSRAKASNLSFTGTIQRLNGATTVRVSGSLSY